MNLISTSGNGSFKVLEGHQEIFKLNYTNWFLGKAEAFLDRQKIEIKPKGIFQTKSEIRKHGKNIGTIGMSWNGKMHIQYTNEEGKFLKFILERTGFWQSDFCLKNELDEVLMELKASSNWKKLKSDYTIVLKHEDPQVENNELLVYVGYAMNLHVAITSAS